MIKTTHKPGCTAIETLQSRDCDCEDRDWRMLALHALSDLQVLGVPIEKMIDVDGDVLADLEWYQRTYLGSYS